MILRVLPFISLLLLTASTSGCGARRFECPCGSTTGCPVDVSQVVTVPEAVPTSELASFQEVDDALPSQQTTDEYTPLSLVDTQCSAASNAITSNLLENEAQLAEALVESRHGKTACAVQLQRDLIMFRSLADRAETAATAATSFYKLAQAEALHTILQNSLQELAEALRQAERLRREALVGSDVVEQLQRQQVEMREQLAELLLNRIRLNGQLRVLLDCPLDAPSSFWPEANLHVSMYRIDKDFEVSEGLGTRPDLRALRLALCRLDKTTLPIARGVMGAADGSLGTVVTGGRIRNLTERGLVDYEVLVRDQQLRALLYEREEQVTAQILAAAWQIETAQRNVALASERLASRRREVERAQQMRETNGVTALDVKAARLQTHQAEAEFIQAIIALRLAEVELQRAKGTLAVDCGYDWDACCNDV